MALLDDFKVRFANDTKLDLTAIEANWATLDLVWECYYGVQYGSNSCDDEAIFQLIAHLWIAEKQTNNTSPLREVQSKSVGSVSGTYTTTSENSPFFAFFNTSIYGQRFLQLTQKNRGVFYV